MTTPNEVTRVLRDGSEIATVMEPSDTAGLAIAPAIVLPSSDSSDTDDDDVWCAATVQPAGEAPTACGLERPCPHHDDGTAAREGGSDSGASPLVATDQWVVLHTPSSVAVTGIPTPRVIAHQLAHELGTRELDWTLARSEITGEHLSLYLTAVREALARVWDFVGLTDGEFTARRNDQEVA